MKVLGQEWQSRERLGLIQVSEEHAAKELLKSLAGLKDCLFQGLESGADTYQLALAIVQAAELIKNPDIGGTTIASTYHLFHEHRLMLPPRQSGERSDTVKSLDTLWSMTFYHLTPNARDLLAKAV